MFTLSKVSAENIVKNYEVNRTAYRVVWRCRNGELCSTVAFMVLKQKKVGTTRPETEQTCENLAKGKGPVRDVTRKPVSTQSFVLLGCFSSGWEGDTGPC